MPSIKTKRAKAPSKFLDRRGLNANMVLLAGPSGAGKSTLAGLLEKKGWERLDGDALAKSLYVPGSPLLRSIAKAFGPKVLKRDASLDLIRLGEIVFPSLTRRKKLSRLVYPRFLRALRSRIKAARQAQRRLVAEVAVYFDLGAPRLGLPLVLVLAPLGLRVRRLHDAGVPLQRARARARALVFGAAQRGQADLILDGRKDPELLLRELLRGLKALSTASKEP